MSRNPQTRRLFLRSLAFGGGSLALLGATAVGLVKSAHAVEAESSVKASTHGHRRILRHEREADRF